MVISSKSSVTISGVGGTILQAERAELCSDCNKSLLLTMASCLTSVRGFTVFPLIEAGSHIQAGGLTAFVQIQAGSLEPGSNGKYHRANGIGTYTNVLCCVIRDLLRYLRYPKVQKSKKVTL